MDNRSLLKRILSALLTLAVMFGSYALAESSEDLKPGSITVTDLRATQGLDDSWVNILFLGANSLALTAASHSSTIMICSINKLTGEVKITSLMGDTEVRIEGKSCKLSSAYTYGGAKLAVRTVNEYFGMNITMYVVVDFTGFASLVEKIGGIEVDLTEDEISEINKVVLNQYDHFVMQGSMKSEAARKAYDAGMLEKGGTGIHLNGMQTLAYARIRTANSDFERTERQRRMLNLLIVKLKTKNTFELLELLLDSMDVMKINLDTNTIMALGMRILFQEAFSSAGTFAVPVQGSYREKRLGSETVLGDVDFEINRQKLHSFIYR